MNPVSIYTKFQTVSISVIKVGGKTDAQQARGAALTMKQSIEHPNAIVSHQSFWLYECFPHGLVNNFKDRWVFLYPWNKPSAGNPRM